MTVPPVCGPNIIILSESRTRTGRNRFLSQVQMGQAGDQAAFVEFKHFLFKAPGAVHNRIELPGQILFFFSTHN